MNREKEMTKIALKALDDKMAMDVKVIDINQVYNGLHQCREWDRPRPVAGSASLRSVAGSYQSHQK